MTFGVGIENQDEKYPAQLQAMLGKEYEVKKLWTQRRFIVKERIQAILDITRV